jgi:hypothetical protein
VAPARRGAALQRARTSPSCRKFGSGR